MNSYQGVMFSVVLSERGVSLRLFRLLPIAWVRLDHVDSLRAASGGEFVRYFFTRPFRTQLWPAFALRHGREAMPRYMIRTYRGRRIFLRLESKYHYLLRTLIGRHKAERAALRAARP